MTLTLRNIALGATLLLSTATASNAAVAGFFEFETSGNYAYSAPFVSTSTVPASLIAEGLFEITNQLPAFDLVADYVLSFSVTLDGDTFSDAIDFGTTSLLPIANHPDYSQAISIIGALPGSPSGSVNIEGFELSYNLNFNDASWAHASGGFSISLTDSSAGDLADFIDSPDSTGQFAFSARLEAIVPDSSVSAVPLPAGLPLLLGALAPLGFAARRRKSK